MPFGRRCAFGTGGSCRIYSLLLVGLLMGGLNSAIAQPSLVDHRYMVSEHTAVNRIAGFLTAPDHNVEIRGLHLPEEVTVGEPVVFTVLANVETASLPITVEWDFPGAEKKHGLSARHAFESPGEFNVTVRVANRTSVEEESFTVRVLRSDVQS